MAERFELTAQEAADRLARLAGAMCSHCEVPELHLDVSTARVGAMGMKEYEKALDAMYEQPTLRESFSPAPGYMRFVWSDGGVANVEVRSP